MIFNASKLTKRKKNILTHFSILRAFVYSEILYFPIRHVDLEDTFRYNERQPRRKFSKNLKTVRSFAIATEFITEKNS
jgi:hypothetical protein